MKTQRFRRILLAIAIVAATASYLPASVETWNRDGLYGVYDPVAGREWLSLSFTTQKSLNYALNTYVNPPGSTFHLATLAEVLVLVQHAGVRTTGEDTRSYAAYAAASDLISKWGMTWYNGVEYSGFMCDDGSGLVYGFCGNLNTPPWGLYTYGVGPPANADYSSSQGTALVRNVGTVPEPSTLVLWSGLGAMGLLALWRRRRRTA
jgi:MYXO-CTERM domain-containing protein